MMAFKYWMRQSKATGELARERTVQRTSGHVTRQPDVCRQYTGVLRNQLISSRRQMREIGNQLSAGACLQDVELEGVSIVTKTFQTKL